MAFADMILDDLLRLVAQGNTEALAQLYQKTDKAVYAYALSILRCAHDAEDVLQECFIKIFHSATYYKPNGKPMAWILTIARNLSMDILRRRSRTVELSENAWLNLAAADTTDDDRLILTSCMELLDETERQIVVLHVVAGFKHRQVAEFLGLSLSNVLSKYHRSIRKMKRRVQE